ncbi:MAG: hypothetical protein IKD79_07535 [Oscillospiraceae bacterium]|nr:hypothetical protein [Oscillospiraceae bacterium]
MKMDKKVSKWLALAALLLFVSATFQIANDQFIMGVVFFGAAACFASAANTYREKEKEEKQAEADGK